MKSSENKERRIAQSQLINTLEDALDPADPDRLLRLS
jgi:hypothetical protein